MTTAMTSKLPHTMPRAAAQVCTGAHAHGRRRLQRDAPQERVRASSMRMMIRRTLAATPHAVLRAHAPPRRQHTIAWHDTTALTVIYAAKGYPGTPEKGSEIKNLEQASQQPDSLIFHAGTARTPDGRIVANGGRVLAVTGFGSTVTEAKARATAALDVIDWPGGFHRTDIGWREIAREQGR